MSQSIPVNSDESEDKGDVSLPCLNSNISIINQINTQKLSTQHRKSAFILKESIEHLAQKFGIGRLAFLTLTFADHVICAKEAQRRLNSLITNVIKKRYQEYVGVFERQKSGRIHYHLLIVLDTDIRKGVNFTEISKRNYRSANAVLRNEWAFWRKTSINYKFGRTELLPIKTSSEVISKYISKYIAKHIENRKDEDKGVRLVRYSKGARVGTTRFMFNSANSKKWRCKVSKFARMLEKGYLKFKLPSDLLRYYSPNLEVTKVRSLEDIAKRLDDIRWAYRYREFIITL